MVLYKVNNKWYVMDNGRGKGPQGINGPFNSIEDLPYKILNIEGKNVIPNVKNFQSKKWSCILLSE